MFSSQNKAVLTEQRQAKELLSEQSLWSAEMLSDSGIATSDHTDALKRSILQHFTHTLGRDIDTASPHALYSALALAVRDRLMDQWRITRMETESVDTRRTCYMSLEFLMGRSLSNAVQNLDLVEPVRQALNQLGMAVEDLESLEHDAGLGNGGLGRLAACFLDSCASIGLPVTGYGLRYRYGMFRQEIENGHQIEKPDNWLRDGHVWEIERPEHTCVVRFGGRVQPDNSGNSPDGRQWLAADEVLAVPFDVPVPGHGNGIVNTLRLWSASATDEFDLSEFNEGGYAEAVAAKTEAENITMVLYPNDSSENGKVLRLRQQYFLVSASLQDALRIWLRTHDNFDEFANIHCFQMNDTHPSMAVAELMRLLIDEHGIAWDEAWSIVTRCMAYTNHTLLPEALECWSLDMLEALLPRLTEIIQEINRRFLLQVARQWPGDAGKQAHLSIVSFDEAPVVRMAHLAIVGSFSVNGVAQLHSDLLQKGLFKDFYQLWPDRFNNKTNGVTQRRWLAYCNPGLRALLNEEIGTSWIHDLEQLKNIESKIDDAGLQQRWLEVKNQNKTRLAKLVFDKTGIAVPTNMLFDVQVKRMHEYKRQLLCALHAVHCYLQIINNEQIDAQASGHNGEQTDAAPRFILIAGKAAPGYYMAKAIVKLINNVATVINSDPRTQDKLRLVFLPDYNVSAMEIIAPAADLSEQISTAGKEASGTGNMKFMMNGALTIGTLDGANVEILDAVGAKNFFLFGLTVDEVEALRPSYSPAAVTAVEPRVKAILDAFESGMFDCGDGELLAHAISAATNSDDPWMTIADLPAYLDAQQRVSECWHDQTQWTRMSMLNTANSGHFSTDRTMHEYNKEIWNLSPLGTPPTSP